MAREHGRIRYQTWSDDDFRALKEAEQRAYMLALTQPGLSYCGVVPFTLRRWARLASDSSVVKLRKSIRSLQQARYVVVDEDTEEMLIRSFLRHDGILDSPNIVRASVKDFDNVGSKVLRAVFVIETFRLLNEDPRLGHDRSWDDVLAPWLADVLPRTFPPRFPEGLPPAFTRTLYQTCGEEFVSACARDARAASRAAPAPAPSPKSSPRRRGQGSRPAWCEVHQRDEPCSGCAADRKARAEPGASRR